ncbi:MAG: AMP-binding protein [Vicinamibacterales bacterium]
MIPSPWTTRSIPDLFDAAADMHTDRCAIDDGAAAWTYRELRVRVDAVAAEITRALPPGERGCHIGLFAEPSAPAIAGLLGILRAGHVYVPLDPDDPAERLRFIASDARLRLIVAVRDRRHAADALAATLSLDVVEISQPLPPPGAPAVAVSTVAPESVAFVLYTSGSTGQPKGVLQTHRNLLHYAWHFGRFHALGPGQRMSLVFSLGFSASSMGLYSALLTGATLCIFNVRTQGAAALGAWLAASRVTILHTVPTVWRVLVQHPPSGGLPALRTIDLGAEALFTHEVAPARQRLGTHIRLTTRLAATEVSLIAQGEIGEVPDGSGPVAVGHPAGGALVRVVREDGASAAPGESGAIVIHSPYLSPGYWQRPALTAERFADDPERPGWRTYRGGDTGMLDAEGRLTVLGRTDAVVKVRGALVHLAEVEGAMRAVAGVRDAAVVPVTDAAGAVTGLAGFFTSEQGDAADVRRALAATLPGYAVPSELHRLADLPLTATGKIDRSVLASRRRPEPSAAEMEQARNETERLVATLVCRVLELPAIGRTADVFEHGCDSLRLTLLQLAIEQHSGRTLTPQALVAVPTVAGIADLLRHTNPTPRQASAMVMPVRTGGSRPPLFLVHGGRGDIPGRRLLEAIGPDQPLWAFRARGMDGRTPPHRTIAEMASAYVAEMRRVQPEGPYFLGSVCAGGLIAAEMARELRTLGAGVAPLVLIDPPRLPRHQGPVSYALKAGMLGLAWAATSTTVTRSLLRTAQEWRGVARSGEVRPEQTPVWVSFRIASYRHQPAPYDGPVCVLASEGRLATAEASWRRYLTGEVQLFTVPGGHADLFTPDNHDTPRQLRACMDAGVAWFTRQATGAGSTQHLGAALA